jgi:hypothetical protein
MLALFHDIAAGLEGAEGEGGVTRPRPGRPPSAVAAIAAIAQPGIVDQGFTKAMM